MRPDFLENHRSEHEDTFEARAYDFGWADLERRLLAGEGDHQRDRLHQA